MEIDKKTLSYVGYGAFALIVGYLLFHKKTQATTAAAAPAISPGSAPSAAADKAYRRHRIMTNGTGVTIMPGGAPAYVANPNNFTLPGRNIAMPVTNIHWYALENAGNDAYWQGVDVGKISVQLQPNVTVSSIQALLDKYGLVPTVQNSMLPVMAGLYTYTVPAPSKEKTLSMVNDFKANPLVVFAEPPATVPVTATTATA